jgi:hypothetical protein
MLLTRAEALKRAQEAIDYKSRSYVEDARNLALYVLNADEKLRAVVALVEAARSGEPEAIERAAEAAKGMVE